MKNLKAILLGMSFAMLIPVASFASNKIEVCLVPLRELIKVPLLQVAIGSFQHMFVRSEGEGLNFEPENPVEVMDGKAQIGRQTYADHPVECETIFSTDDAGEFAQKWAEFTAQYEAAAQLHRYSFNGTNCQIVTKEVLSKLGYPVPERLQHTLDEQKACVVQ